MISGSTKRRHAFTVDMEDWYQGIELDRSQWADKERRLDRGLDVLLALLDDAGVQATFFVLGVVAEEHPDLVRRVADSGHDIGSHGYDHSKVYDLSPDRFREDETRTRGLLQDLIGRAVTCYRAPYFSITTRSLWALEILAGLGYTLDSSISSVVTWRYGIPGAPARPYRIPDVGMVEVPPSNLTFLGRRLGLGGAYFRMLPYGATHGALQAAEDQGEAEVFYIHPWEFDPDHPRIPFEWKARMTHYARLGRTAGLTRRMLAGHTFGTLSEYAGAAERAGELPVLSLDQLADGRGE